MKRIYMKEAMKILGIARTTILRWEKEGKITTKRNAFNNYRIYDKEEIEKLYNEIYREE